MTTPPTDPTPDEPRPDESRAAGSAPDAAALRHGAETPGAPRHGATGEPGLVDRYLAGEATDEDHREIDARLLRDPLFRQGIEGHESLRRHVGRILEAPSAAPDSLEATVRAALRAAEQPAAAPRSGGTVGGSTDRRWWQGTQQANLLAVAATLALVGGAVLFGVFGPRINGRSAVGAGTSVKEVLAWTTSQHRHCGLSDPYLEQKSRWRSLDQASAALTEVLGVPACVPDLSEAGYDFVGAGPCYVPGAQQRSSHMIYESRRDDGVGLVSIFVVPASYAYEAVDAYNRTAPLVPGVDHELTGPVAGTLLYWTSGDLTWFVQTEDLDALDAIRTLTHCN